MMGRQDRDQGQLFYEFSLDEMIPADHLLRRINVFATAVLADLHEQLKAFYSDIGRPSVDASSMALSVCAFAVSPAPATSFISPPLCRTSRQWRCVWSARQQEEPVGRLDKSPSRSRVLADQAPTSARKTPPDSKTNDTTVFFDSIDPTRTSVALTPDP